VEPSLAIPGYLARKRQTLEQELTDNGRAGGALIDDLKSLYSEGQGGRGTLDFLRIVTEPAQTAAEYRRMLAEVKSEYLEFSRPPYAVDPLDEKLVKQAGSGGVTCRLLLEASSLDAHHRQRWDAAGRELPSRMRLRGSELSLEVDDAGASYPLTIDPTLWQQQYKLKSPSTTASAPVLAMSVHFWSAIRDEISLNFTAKVPPNPQHWSGVAISLRVSPGTLDRSWRGCALTPSSRNPEQES
jgi:hypothetical protein